MNDSQSLTSPVSVIGTYIRQFLGFGKKTTKRSLSEEAECGSPESLSEWLRQGSDPNEVDAYGYTPLVNACLKGCIKSAKILINNGADVNKHAMHGYSPLHTACQNGHAELAEFLLDNGAELEVKNDDGDTPLMLAVRSEHPAVVDLLCKRGCNMHAHGFDDIDPIDYAINKRNLYLSDVLMRHERQNLSSSTSVTSADGQASLNSSHNAKFAHQLGKDLQQSPSLTSLIHAQQEIHNQSANDSLFQSD